MHKLIDQARIVEGDRLIEKEGGAFVTVTQVTEDDIAWFKPLPEGGVFGECSRECAASLFANVTPCETTLAC